jgi:hypothetical protein
VAAVPNTPPEAVLSESVSITEDVETYEAEPVAVPVEIENEPEPVTETSEPSPEESSNTENNSSEVVIADMEETPYGVALYSDLISTSTGGVPATTQDDSGGKADQAPFFLELATQPHVVLQILYIIIGLFVFAALLISILIEIKQQHPIQILYGSGLLAIMGVLYYVHMLVSQGALIA